MQHGRHWAGQNPKGWLASEKYRGARAEWDGRTLWSRGGRAIPVPRWWAAELPAGFPLAGEVWSGRGPAGGHHEVDAAQAVTHGRFGWSLRFLVFDAPAVLAPWSQRIRSAAGVLAGASFIRPVGFEPVKNMRHLEQLFAGVARNGGEGLMLRSPAQDDRYTPGRTGALLKVKHDPALVRGVVRVFA